MQFTINGRKYDLTKESVETAMRCVPPDSIQQHAVAVSDVEYPVKQVLSMSTGLPRTDFTSNTAQRVLGRLGFLLLADGSRVPPSSSESVPRVTTSSAAAEWAWEGTVQSMFAEFLRTHGWTVTGEADTATKAHGVDLLATKGVRLLGAEVKGWPSAGYADPRRADEVKRTQPTTQAGHWFSQALMKAVMLLDSHPNHESLMVFPDYPRYRDLADRTRTGRTAARLNVVLVEPSGDAHSETWAP
jgi:hypothetical protein